MSHIDDELAQALRESEEIAAAEPVVAPAPAPSEPRKRSIGLLVALLAMGGGLLTLVFVSFEGASIYSKDVTTIVRDRAQLLGRTLRVQGELRRCTLVRRDQPCEYRFTLHQADQELAIRYAQCILPDTIRDVPGVQVTAEGRLDPAGHFEATNVFGKCSSKYEDDRAKGVEMKTLAPCPMRVGAL